MISNAPQTDTVRHDIVVLKDDKATPFACCMRELPMSHWFDFCAMRSKIDEMELWRADRLQYQARVLQRMRVFYHLPTAENDDCPWLLYGGLDQPPQRPLVELRAHDLLLPGGGLLKFDAWRHAAQVPNELTHFERLPMELIAHVFHYLPTLEDKHAVAAESRRCWVALHQFQISGVVVVAEFDVQ
jgi:hypothetical protein